MELLDETVDGVTVFTLAGALDLMSAQDLQARVADLVKESKTYVVLDLSKTDSFAGAAIRVLLMLRKKLEGPTGGFVLCGASGALVRDLEMAGVAKQLTVVESRAGALKELADKKALTDFAQQAADLLAIGEKREIARFKKEISS